MYSFNYQFITEMPLKGDNGTTEVVINLAKHDPNFIQIKLHLLIPRNPTNYEVNCEPSAS